MNLSKFQAEVHALAVLKGFYKRPRRDLESLMLIVSEVAEAAECVRSGASKTHVIASSKPEGLATELADIVLRVLDFCESKGINLYTAMMRKHNYNKTRPYKHGKKL